MRRATQIKPRQNDYLTDSILIRNLGKGNSATSNIKTEMFAIIK